MSFLRNLRTSLSRGRTPPTSARSNDSASMSPRVNERDDLVVAGAAVDSVPNGSLKSFGRHDSPGTRPESRLNRGETFIVGSSSGGASSCSEAGELSDASSRGGRKSTDKKSKKSKMLSKFSTFTKRKKAPKPLLPVIGSEDDEIVIAGDRVTAGDGGDGDNDRALEHHPKDDATNTYYKWQTEGVGNLDYDSHLDPFNFLYEKQSSLKTMQQENQQQQQKESGLGNGAPELSQDATPFDSSTYCRAKASPRTKEQQHYSPSRNHNNHNDNNNNHQNHQNNKKMSLTSHASPSMTVISEKDKYRTVTLNSFRRSFRDRYLQQQRNATHNPAWFVEVERDPAPSDPPKKNTTTKGAAPTATSTATVTSTSTDDRLSLQQLKATLPNVLIYDNDNYRPTSRSPVRHDRSTVRSTSRSPVKRNETFRVEHPTIRFDSPLSNGSPALSSRTYCIEEHPMSGGEGQESIRIEFKNSITPNVPGRLVPVGVAKPMLSHRSTTSAKSTHSASSSVSAQSCPAAVKITATAPAPAPATVTTASTPSGGKSSPKPSSMQPATTAMREMKSPASAIAHQYPSSLVHIRGDSRPPAPRRAFTAAGTQPQPQRAAPVMGGGGRSPAKVSPTRIQLSGSDNRNNMQPFARNSSYPLPSRITALAYGSPSTLSMYNNQRNSTRAPKANTGIRHNNYNNSSAATHHPSSHVRTGGHSAVAKTHHQQQPQQQQQQQQPKKRTYFGDSPQMSANSRTFTATGGRGNGGGISTATAVGRSRVDRNAAATRGPAMGNGSGQRQQRPINRTPWR